MKNNRLAFTPPPAWLKVPAGRLTIHHRSHSSNSFRFVNILFDHRMANGFAKGKNNRIKTIKRAAYGYRNMDNFRLRILAANPGCKVEVSHLLTQNFLK